MFEGFKNRLQGISSLSSVEHGAVPRNLFYRECSPFTTDSANLSCDMYLRHLFFPNSTERSNAAATVPIL